MAECRRCEQSTSSVPGATSCDVCAEGYFAPLDASGECVPCVEWASCGFNTSTATLQVNDGWWRHSLMTVDAHKCERERGYSPCAGGGLANEPLPGDGDGYCHADHRGPRCELCRDRDGAKYYFDRYTARCKECPSGRSRAILAIALATMAMVCIFGALAAGVALLESSRQLNSKTYPRAQQALSAGRRSFEFCKRAGMRSKLKILIGTYQCIAAIPSVFNVSAPESELADFMRTALLVIEAPTQLGIDLILPADPSCLGSWTDRLIVAGLWPLSLLLVAAIMMAVWEVVHAHRSGRLDEVGVRRVLVSSVRHVAPLAVLLTFLVVPSTSERIFKTFLSA